MTQTLYVSNSKHIASHHVVEADLAPPGSRLLIFSGIAIPGFWTNHDEEAKRDEFFVRFERFAVRIAEGAAQVGLASIANDETAFLFGLDESLVIHDEISGEISLHVKAAILGEQTWLHRFGYQAVVRVLIPTAISGSIRVPREIVDLQGVETSEIETSFAMEASPAGSGKIPPEHPMQIKGQVLGVRQVRSDVYVMYTIKDVPMNVPLEVTVRLAGRLQGGQLEARQVAGPSPVTITAAVPGVTGVDFVVGRLEGPP